MRPQVTVHNGTKSIAHSSLDAREFVLERKAHDRLQVKRTMRLLCVSK
jgi:hypothetical protein